MVYKDLLTVLAITIIAVLLLIESILSKAWDGVFLIVLYVMDSLKIKRFCGLSEWYYLQSRL